MSCAKINYYPSNRVLEMNRLGLAPELFELLELFKAVPRQKRSEALQLLKDYHMLPEEQS